MLSQVKDDTPSVTAAATADRPQPTRRQGARARTAMTPTDPVETTAEDRAPVRLSQALPEVLEHLHRHSRATAPDPDPAPPHRSPATRPPGRTHRHRAPAPRPVS
ncbi:hypothetical protein IDM40_17510 [Nocardiopsis sp. HNM0947]|uniref:Uncharacterized protein n=1 Tax=Nocardiopsis coralli TaxID=2772213 RepID=A0ABR9P9Y0_9ACTN|nr:hypothetical protein [Nocardiopsis coralli]MBE3000485.1 hypothetical protein [Nocardiopsis coralli]